MCVRIALRSSTNARMSRLLRYVLCILVSVLCQISKYRCRNALQTPGTLRGFGKVPETDWLSARRYLASLETQMAEMRALLNKVRSLTSMQYCCSRPLVSSTNNCSPTSIYPKTQIAFPLRRVLSLSNRLQRVVLAHQRRCTTFPWSVGPWSSLRPHP